MTGPQVILYLGLDGLFSICHHLLSAEHGHGDEDEKRKDEKMEISDHFSNLQGSIHMVWQQGGIGETCGSGWCGDKVGDALSEDI